MTSLVSEAQSSISVEKQFPNKEPCELLLLLRLLIQRKNLIMRLRILQKKKPMFDKTRDNALIMGEEKCFLILSQVHLYLKKLVHFCDNYFNWVGNC